MKTSQNRGQRHGWSGGQDFNGSSENARSRK
jgi:hypothetical protein